VDLVPFRHRALILPLLVDTLTLFTNDKTRGYISLYDKSEPRAALSGAWRARVCRPSLGGPSFFPEEQQVSQHVSVCPFPKNPSAPRRTF